MKTRPIVNTMIPVGLLVTVLVASWQTIEAMASDLRVDDRGESRVDRRTDRRENAADGVEDRVDFR
jgi:hypothetical protein